MKKTLLTLAAGAGAVALLASCQSSNVAYPGGEEEAIMMSDATDPGVIPPWATEEDIQVPAGATTEDRNNYAIPEGPVAGSTSQNQPKVSSQNQPDVASANGSDVVVENDPLTNLDTPNVPVHESAVTRTGGSRTSAGKGGKKPVRRISNAKPTLVTYKVRPGDNLTVIAKRSNTTVDQIRKDSKLKSDVIRPGQIIKVRYTPKGYKAPAKGAQKGAKGSVTVKKGDSLSSIAARQGVTVAQLKAANGLSGDTIRAGQKLTIPSKASSSKKGTSKKKSSRRKR